MITEIFDILGEVLRLASGAIADQADAPPTLVEMLARFSSELAELRADKAGRQDAEDRAEVDAP